MTLSNWNVPTWLQYEKSEHWNTVLSAANTETHKKKAAARLICVHHPAHTYLHRARFIFVLFLWWCFISKQTVFFSIPRSKLSPFSSQVVRKLKYLLAPKVLLDYLRPLITIRSSHPIRTNIAEHDLINLINLINLVSLLIEVNLPRQLLWRNLKTFNSITAIPWPEPPRMSLHICT